MKHWSIWAVVVVLATHAQAGAQTNLVACLSGGGLHPLCEEVHGSTYIDLWCGPTRFFFTYEGRVAWPPMRCVGPITIELNTRAIEATRFPLYVEIVPMPRFGGGCPTNYPGVLVMEAHGGDQCGGIWETKGPIDITSIVPLNSWYAIQLVFFQAAYGGYSSPALDCIRVTATPVTTVEPATWTMVKSLYRD